MDKREYTRPELKELGSLEDVTLNSWDGMNFDGALPEEMPELFS